MRILSPILLALSCSVPTSVGAAPDGAHAPPSAHLPLSHPVYDLLDRLDARGVFASSLPGIRPYAQSRVDAIAAQALEHADLTRAERAGLVRYRDLHAPDDESSPAGRLFGGRVYTFADSVLRMRANPIVRQSVTAWSGDVPEDLVSQTYVGVRIDGTVHGRVAFRVQHFEAREWSDVPKASRRDVRARPLEAVQLKGKSADFRETRFQLRFDRSWLTVDVGKEAFGWGPGRDANVFLHAAAPSYPYARIRFSHRALTFEHLYVALRTPPDDVTLGTTTTSNGHRRTLPAAKRLITHRLELELSDRLRVGVQEAVVFGDRGFDPAYAVPVAVLIGAQAYAGETDNLAFGVDASYRLGSATVFAALFLDDLAKFSPGAFSNQLGFQAGTRWADPLGLAGIDLLAEYARFEPYTYAHDFDINAYTHFDATLGHPLGPNADAWRLGLRWWALPALRLDANLSRAREGDNYRAADGTLVNVGGDPAQGRRPADAPTRDFLSGDRRTTTAVSVSARLTPAPALTVDVAAVHRAVRSVPVLGPSSDASERRLSLTASLNAF